MQVKSGRVSSCSWCSTCWGTATISDFVPSHEHCDNVNPGHLISLQLRPSTECDFKNNYRKYVYMNPYVLLCIFVVKIIHSVGKVTCSSVSFCGFHKWSGNLESAYSAERVSDQKAFVFNVCSFFWNLICSYITGSQIENCPEVLLLLFFFAITSLFALFCFCFYSLLYNTL